MKVISDDGDPMRGKVWVRLVIALTLRGHIGGIVDTKAQRAAAFIFGMNSMPVAFSMASIEVM